VRNATSSHVGAVLKNIGNNGATAFGYVVDSAWVSANGLSISIGGRVTTYPLPGAGGVAFTGEDAQDAIGAALNTTEFTYIDGSNQIVLNKVPFSKIEGVPPFVDQTIPAHVRNITLQNIQAWSQAGSNVTFSDGLKKDDAGNVRAQYLSPIWNANRIQGYPIDAAICNGCVPYLDSANRIIRWRLPEGAVAGGNGGNVDLSAIYESLAAIQARLDSVGIVATDGLTGSSGATVGDRDTIRLSRDWIEWRANVDAQIGNDDNPTIFVSYEEYQRKTDSLQARINAIQPAAAGTTYIDPFTGTTNNQYTLRKTPVSLNDVEVYVGVLKVPNALLSLSVNTITVNTTGLFLIDTSDKVEIKYKSNF